jgi:hypothetical protein
MSEFRKHYAANRKRMREFRAKKFANMRAAKERKEQETVDCVPDVDTSQVRKPRMPAAAVSITVNIRGRRFRFSAHDGPWNELFPSRTSLVEAVRNALRLP